MGSIAIIDNNNNSERSKDTLTFEQATRHLLSYGPGGFSPHIITRASGSSIFTADDRQILDWTSGQMSCLVGHGHPEIVETITYHATHLDHLFSGFISPPVVSLAEKLTSVMPDGMERVMFLSTGGESNEAAIRLAKVLTGRWEIVGLSSSWHGMTGAAIPGNHALPTPNAYRSPFRNPDGSYDWETELDYGWSLIDRASVGSLAAVIMEPVLSSGGMITLPNGYMTAMKRHCQARGMLLIVDEAQTGLGRCGDMFGFQQDPGMVPDIVTLSKTLGNGMPLSAVVTSDKLADQAKDKGFLFYTTHVNDPLPAAVGLKTLEIVLRDALVERSRRSGEILINGFRNLMERYACIGDVRGRGLMIGVEIVKDRRLPGSEGKEPNVELGQILCDKMLEMGLSANLMGSHTFGGIFRIAPPIIIEEKEIMQGLEIFERAFQETNGTLFLG
ncbi:hypothetical protein B7463_g5529, partial [Scytalidium lignicola]